MKYFKFTFTYFILFFYFFQLSINCLENKSSIHNFIDLISQLTDDEKAYKSLEKEKSEDDNPRFSVFGNRSMKYKTYWIKGSEGEFLTNNGLLYYNAKLEQSSNLQFSAEFERNVLMSGEFIELPYQDRILTLRISGKRGSAKIGDFSEQFGYGDFSGFSKSIRGIYYEYNLPSLKFKTVLSKEKSYRKVESFKGRNINGPYRLGTTLIIEGSEVIKMNGEVIERAQYKIDYFLGEINFLFKIDPTETVEVSYEAEIFSPIRMGSFRGIMTEYKLKNLILTSTFLSSEEDKLTKLIVIDKTKEIDVKTEDIIKATKFNLENSRIVKQYEIVTNKTIDRILIRDEDYNINYVDGEIDFKSPFASGTIEVKFSYYNPQYIDKMVNEELRGSGRLEYSLSKNTIYAGTEYVKLYQGLVHIKQLKVGEDYIINEDRNLIVFSASSAPSEAANQYVLINYEFITKTNPEKMEIEKRLFDFSVDYTKSSKFQMKGEYGLSEGDVSKKFVSITEGILSPIATGSKEFLLCKCQPILESVEIYFNDTSTSFTRKWEGSDYTIEFNPQSVTTKIKFRELPPAGTIVTANFKYRPKRQGDNVKDGKAWKIRSNFNGKVLKLKSEFMKKDLTFTSFNDYNDFRDKFTNIDAEISIGKGLSLTSNFSNNNYSLGFADEGEEKISNVSNGLKYNGKKLKEAYIQYENFNRDVLGQNNRINIERNDTNFYLSYDIFGSGDGIGLFYQTRNYKDNSYINSSQKDIEKGKIELGYKKGDNFQLKSYYEISDIKSKYLRQQTILSEFKTTSYSKSFNINWIPINNINVAGDLNFTNKEDTRDEVPEESIDTADIGITGKDLGKISSFSARFYRQTTPDTISYGSKTDIKSSEFAYNITKVFYISPQYSITKTTSGEKNYTKYTTRGISISNQKASPRLESTFFYSVNENESGTVKSVSSREDLKMGFVLNYKYSEPLIIYFREDFTKYKGLNEKDNVLTGRLNYNLSDFSKIGFNVIQDKKITRNNSIVRDKYILELETKLSKIFSLNLNYEFQNYNSGQQGKDYRASILNSELRADF